MSEIGIGVIFLILLLCLFLTGLELAFAMGIIGVLGFAWIVNWKAAMGLMANDVFDALANYGLTVIPLFVLMGQIAFNAGIAKRLFDCAHKFLGHIPGGLAIATVCLLYTSDAADDLLCVDLGGRRIIKKKKKINIKIL